MLRKIIDKTIKVVLIPIEVIWGSTESDKLLFGIKINSLNLVQQAIAEGANINDTIYHYHTLKEIKSGLFPSKEIQCLTYLSYAIVLKRIEIAKFFIKMGAWLNDDNYYQPLHYALKFSPELINDLISYGAKVYMSKEDKILSPLAYTLIMGESEEQWKTIIDHPNVTSNMINEVVNEELTIKGLNINTDEKKCKIISETYNIKVNHEGKLKNLSDGVIKNDEEKVQKALEEGIDVNSIYFSRDHILICPLVKALLYNRLDMAEFLIKQGADVNLTNVRNYGVLHTYIKISSPNKTIKVVEFLIKKGADVNEMINQGISILCSAIECFPAAIPTLISSGAKVDFKIYNLSSPLCKAMSENYKSSFDMIVNCGEVSSKTIQNVLAESKKIDPQLCYNSHLMAAEKAFKMYVTQLQKIYKNKKNSEQIFEKFFQTSPADKQINFDKSSVDLIRLVTLFKAKIKQIKDNKKEVEKYLVMLDILDGSEMDEMLKLLIPHQYLKEHDQKKGALTSFKYQANLFSSDILFEISKYLKTHEVCKLHMLTTNLWNDFKTIIMPEENIKQTIIVGSSVQEIDSY